MLVIIKIQFNTADTLQAKKIARRLGWKREAPNVDFNAIKRMPAALRDRVNYAVVSKKDYIKERALHRADPSRPLPVTEDMLRYSRDLYRAQDRREWIARYWEGQVSRGVVFPEFKCAYMECTGFPEKAMRALSLYFRDIRLNMDASILNQGEFVSGYYRNGNYSHNYIANGTQFKQRIGNEWKCLAPLIGTNIATDSEELRGRCPFLFGDIEMAHETPSGNWYIGNQESPSSIQAQSTAFTFEDSTVGPALTLTQEDIERLASLSLRTISDT